MNFKIQIITFLFLFVTSAGYTSADNYSSPPIVVNITSSGSDILLNWTNPETDIYGNSSNISKYAVYKSTNPNTFPGGDSLRIAVSGTSYTDKGATNSESNRYYYVQSVTEDGTESLLPSPMACKIRHDLIFDPSKENIHWISVPTNPEYQKAADLLLLAPEIEAAVSWDFKLQQEIRYNRDGSGTDFDLEPGRAYGIVISGSTVINLLGTYESVEMTVEKNSDNFNTAWLSLPQPSPFAKASDVLQDLHHVSKLGMYDPHTETYRSWFHLDGTWMGDDFELDPGKGLLAVFSENTTWKPSSCFPWAEALADKREGLNSLEVNFSGTAGDKFGTVEYYQWDFQGDGSFDYSDAGTPDTSFTFPPGTWYPTLLVTNSRGGTAYDYKKVQVYALTHSFFAEAFNPAGGSFPIFYNISYAGKVNVYIYDQNGTLVQALATDKPVTEGANSEIWDGRNSDGEIVTNGEYHVVIEFTAESGFETLTYDLSKSTGGEDITSEISNLVISDTLSPLEGRYVNISYTLPKKSLVSVEITDSSGNIIRHLLSRSLRASGTHTEVWQGTRDNGLPVAPGTYFFVKVKAVSLPESAIIVNGLAPEIMNLSVSRPRFSPALNPYGNRQRSVGIAFDLNKPSDMQVSIIDSSESIIRTFTVTGLDQGENQVAWNGRNNNGILASDGIYSISLRAVDADGTFSETQNVPVEIYY